MVPFFGPAAPASPSAPAQQFSSRPRFDATSPPWLPSLGLDSLRSTPHSSLAFASTASPRCRQRGSHSTGYPQYNSLSPDTSPDTSFGSSSSDEVAPQTPLDAAARIEHFSPRGQVYVDEFSRFGSGAGEPNYHDRTLSPDAKVFLPSFDDAIPSPYKQRTKHGLGIWLDDSADEDDRIEQLSVRTGVLDLRKAHGTSLFDPARHDSFTFCLAPSLRTTPLAVERPAQIASSAALLSPQPQRARLPSSPLARFPTADPTQSFPAFSSRYDEGRRVRTSSRLVATSPPTPLRSLPHSPPLVPLDTSLRSPVSPTYISAPTTRTHSVGPGALQSRASTTFHSHASPPAHASSAPLSPTTASLGTAHAAYPLSASDTAKIAQLHNGRVPSLEQLAPPQHLVAGQAQPIVNTGNFGPMIVQAGDWKCGVCAFVNWRRRKICLKCFPFANDLGHILTIQSQRAAYLAQPGTTITAESIPALAPNELRSDIGLVDGYFAHPASAPPPSNSSEGVATCDVAALARATSRSEPTLRAVSSGASRPFEPFASPIPPPPPPSLASYATHSSRSYTTRLFEPFSPLPPSAPQPALAPLPSVIWTTSSTSPTFGRASDGSTGGSSSGCGYGSAGELAMRNAAREEALREQKKRDAAERMMLATAEHLNKPPAVSPVDSLPEEVTLVIFAQLDYGGLRKASAVCKQWQALVQDKRLDAKLFRKKPFVKTLAKGRRVAHHPMLNKVDCVNVKRDMAEIWQYWKDGDGDSNGHKINAFTVGAVNDYATYPACTKMSIDLQCGNLAPIGIVKLTGVTVRDVLNAVADFWSVPLTSSVKTRLRRVYGKNWELSRIDMLGDHRFFEGWETPVVQSDGSVRLAVGFYGS